MQDVVSIIIPCYNNAQYLSDALDSVLKQTYTNWECIIINDGSTDNTKEVVNNWLVKDKRFKYIEILNSGVCVARNIGIDKAIGKYILPLDSDDKITEDYLYLAVKAFADSAGSLKVVYCDARFFGEKNKIFKLKPFSLKNLAENNVLFNCALFKKEDCLAIGKYDINLKNGLEDWEFWINLLKKGGEVYKIPKICFFYRQTEGSRNVSITHKDYKEIFEYISVKHADFFVKQYGSIIELERNYRKLKKKNLKQTTYKKEVLNLFFKTFFGFKILNN